MKPRALAPANVVRWAVDRKLMRNDPTAGVRVTRPKTDGFHCWSEDEIAQFEAHWPIGSKPRLALALGLYTAQRRADVVRIGRQMIRDDVLTIRQQKTGVTLAIPVHPELAAIVTATPAGHESVKSKRAEVSNALNGHTKKAVG
jgi:integrase